MTEYRLTPRTVFGSDTPRSATIGACTLAERPDIALASLAARAGHADAVRGALQELVGGPLDVSCYHAGAEFSAFWAGPDQWFVMADHGAHETLGVDLKAKLGDQVSVTEQNDGWVAIDIDGDATPAVLERLCNIALAPFGDGRAQRTVIEHINCFVLCREQGHGYRILCGRSYAQSLWHALDAAAVSVAAIAQLNPAQ